MKTSYYNQHELPRLGFKSVGSDVRISRKTSFYGTKNMSIGNHVRIDDFSVLSGRINIGSYVHIATFCALYGGDAGIIIKDFVGISSRVSVYALTDDYGGEFMANASIPAEFRRVIRDSVRFEKHVIVGAGAVILPGSVLGEGAAIGALSLVQRSVPPWTIQLGVPLRIVGHRRKDLLKLEDHLMNQSSPLSIDQKS